MKVSEILPPDLKNRIRGSLANLNDAVQILAAADKCDLECQEQKAQVENLYAQLNKLVQHFGA